MTLFDWFFRKSAAAVILASALGAGGVALLSRAPKIGGALEGLACLLAVAAIAAWLAPDHAHGWNPHRRRRRR